MNTTRNNRKVLAATLLVALVGSLAACNSVERTQTQTVSVAHGAGELTAYLQIDEQIHLARATNHGVSSAQAILDDIATERERLHPSSAAQTIADDIAKERDRLAAHDAAGE